MTNLYILSEKIICCRRCPRLVAFRETVPARASFTSQEYWRKPIPGFGDPNAWLLILGLAPSAHGANRTGRIFTGDPSGTFLMKCLHSAGFANQPTSESIDDGLMLRECYITASVKCVPPSNHPLGEEFINCSPYLENEFYLLKNLKAVLALGKLAFDTYLSFLKKAGAFENGQQARFPFFHGSHCKVAGWPDLYGSYHPSPQNTYTRKLTEKMLVELLLQIKSAH